jgi:hypothetical protein
MDRDLNNAEMKRPDGVELDEEEESWIKEVEKSLKIRNESALLAAKAWGTTDQFFSSGGKISSSKFVCEACSQTGTAKSDTLTTVMRDKIRNENKISISGSFSDPTHPLVGPYIYSLAQSDGRSPRMIVEGVSLQQSVLTKTKPAPQTDQSVPPSASPTPSLSSTLLTVPTDEERVDKGDCGDQRNEESHHEWEVASEVVRDYLEACARQDPYPQFGVKGPASFAANRAMASNAACIPAAVPVRLRGMGTLELQLAHMHIGDTGACALAAVLHRLKFLQVLVGAAAFGKPPLF